MAVKCIAKTVKYTGCTLKLHIFSCKKVLLKRPKMTKSNLTARNLSVQSVYNINSINMICNMLHV